MKRSLSFKLNVANSALILMVCLMVTLSFYNILEKRITSWANEEMADVINTLTLTLEARAHSTDMQRVVGALAAKPSIVRISILSNDNIVADSKNQFVGNTRQASFDEQVNLMLADVKNGGKEAILSAQGGLVHQAVKLFLIDNDKQRLRPYIVYVTYNSTPIEALAMTELKEFIVIQAIGFLLMLTINPLIQREVVLKPIRAIRQQIINNPRLPINWRSADEFGLMVDSYNQSIRLRQQKEKELLQSRHYIDKVTNVIPVQLGYVDRHYQFRFVNRRLLQWLDQKESDILGQDIRKVMPDQLSMIIQPHVKRVLSGRIQSFEAEIHTVGKAPVYLQSTYVPDINAHQEVVGFFLCVEDITRIKANEQRIESYAQEMEFKNWALTEATEKAELATRSKADFLACMSHEIRTPMNGVLGILSLLEQTQLTHQQRQYVSVAASSADSLLNLLNDILDFSKVESGKLVIERTHFDLIALIDDLIQPLSMKGEEKGLQLLLDVSAVQYRWVRGDPTRIRQILANLIGNAIKFTQTGWVKVSIALNQYDNRLRLSAEVEDTGIGIDEEHQANLFQPFIQADSSTTRHFGGTGLGLSIARRMCHLMSGDIAVKSREGVGSTFSFHLLMDAGDMPEQESWPPELLGSRIGMVSQPLLADEVLRQTLLAWGADVQLMSVPAAGEPLADIDLLLFSVPETADDLNDTVSLLSSLNPRPEHTLILSSHRQLLSIHNDMQDTIAFSQRPPRLQELVAWLTGQAMVTSTQPGQQLVFDDAQQILLVEDSKVNQLVISGMLRQLGLTQLQVADNGQNALSLLEHTDFDLILMDCQMPIMDGYLATGHIRAGQVGSVNASLPIVALTANAMQGDREKCLAAGMTDYIAKPLVLEVLSDVLSRYLRVTHRMPDDLGGATDLPLTTAAELILTDTPSKLIDLNKALSTFMEDAELLRQALQVFVEEMSVLLAQFQQATDAGELVQVAEICHTLKGASANLAMQPLANQAKATEITARTQDKAQLTVEAQSLVAVFDATCNQVMDLLALGRWTDCPHYNEGCQSQSECGC
ncbi:ATP-binding protein [Shewanella sp. GXUN23E]|uniref:ATP-binding protein n=1 Tax=Shewanella sp. GXUN23E TaxID=3422498 RepID=UPI003D7E7E3C